MAFGWLNKVEKLVGSDKMEQVYDLATRGEDPTSFLIDKKVVSPKKLMAIKSKHWNIPYVNLEDYSPEIKSLDKISEEIARRFVILPLFELENHLYVAISNPEDLNAQEFLRHLTGQTIEPVLAEHDAIIESINRHFLSREKAAQQMGAYVEEVQQKAEESTADISVEDREAPTIKLLNYIITQAINLGASDIHLESFPKKILLRYRVDGILHEFPPPPPHMFRPLIARIKIISNIDIAERRLPQDGRSTFELDNKKYDLRISIIPNLHDEGVVIRILDTQGKKQDIDELGFSEDMLQRYKRLVKNDYGIILVTGPTGSGKTTTLYATLMDIYTIQKKFITLEDPVEYQLSGITQIQIFPDIGYTFALGLRSILRHDPDIIMLGEIRDLESAEIAIRSSLTGHLVLSTLHTNNSVTAVTRLIDMGVAPFKVFASLHGVLAQRLVRRLCNRCKREIPYDSPEIASLDLPPDLINREKHKIYGPVGCQECNNLGYKGRIAVLELLEVTQQMRNLPAGEITEEIIKKLAQSQGMITMKQNAIEKLYQGVTSINEIVNYLALD